MTLQPLPFSHGPFRKTSSPERACHLFPAKVPTGSPSKAMAKLPKSQTGSYSVVKDQIAFLGGASWEALEANCLYCPFVPITAIPAIRQPCHPRLRPNPSQPRPNRPKVHPIGTSQSIATSSQSSQPFLPGPPCQSRKAAKSLDSTTIIRPDAIAKFVTEPS